jgi:hypothetical protein
VPDTVIPFTTPAMTIAVIFLSLVTGIVLMLTPGGRSTTIEGSPPGGKVGLARRSIAADRARGPGDSNGDRERRRGDQEHTASRAR